MNTPNPNLGITDYPFEILLNVTPTDEILEKIYGEVLSEIPEISTTEAEIWAKIILVGSRPVFFYCGFKLSNKGIDGKKLERARLRKALTYLSRKN